MKVDRPKNILITDSGGMAIKLLSHSSPPPSRNHSAIMCNCQSKIKFRLMSLILDCTSNSYNSIRVWKFRLSALGNDQHLDLQRFFFNYIAPWSFNSYYISVCTRPGEVLRSRKWRHGDDRRIFWLWNFRFRDFFAYKNLASIFLMVWFKQGLFCVLKTIYFWWWLRILASHEQYMKTKHSSKEAFFLIVRSSWSKSRIKNGNKETSNLKTVFLI